MGRFSVSLSAQSENGVLRVFLEEFFNLFSEERAGRFWVAYCRGCFVVLIV